MALRVPCAGPSTASRVTLGIKTADWVIDLGPGGGHAGGEVVATGTPEDIAACKASHTGSFLRAHLRAA